MFGEVVSQVKIAVMITKFPERDDIWRRYKNNQNARAKGKIQSYAFKLSKLLPFFNINNNAAAMEIVKIDRTERLPKIQKFQNNPRLGYPVRLS